MMANQSPLFNEQERLRELYAYHVLDSDPEQDFDELVSLAAEVCNCPIASITFVDEDRQWFKASKGLTATETPRSVSFCSFAIREEDILVVEDPSKDERFAANPDVTGGLKIGFYTGVPICSPRGYKLGTICVIDHQPRRLSEGQVASLRIISRQITQLLEMRLRHQLLQEDARKLLSETEHSFNTYFSDEGIPKWIYDLATLKILQVNDAAVAQYGYTREEFIELTVLDLRIAEEKKQIHKLVGGIATHSKSISFETTHRRKDGSALAVAVTLTNMLYKGKRARLATMNDISEKVELRSLLQQDQQSIQRQLDQAKEKERDFLGKELHDNISQILASTKLFLEVAESNPEMTVDMIRLSRSNLVEAISEIRMLSHSLVGEEKQEFGLVSSMEALVDSYVLAGQFELSYHCSGKVEGLPDDMKLTIFRIIQEALNNTSKYADASHVQLEISCNNKITILVQDNGRGFDLRTRKNGIGINNIRHRVQFYNGKADITTAPGAGCRIYVEIPVNRP